MLHMMTFVLGIIFLVIVAPIWIVAHYLTRWRSARKLSAADERSLAELHDAAGKMEARLAALERVLDTETSGQTRAGG